MPSIDHYTSALAHILQRHHIPKVSILGHSFGSITTAWFLARYPQLISHVTILDPVSLLLSLPDVVESFIYRAPSTPAEYIMHYYASKEITISYALHRNFCWHTSVLWLEDIPKSIGVVVGLAKNDEISNAVAQEDYTLRQARLRKQSDGASAEIKCIMWKTFTHGQILFSLNELNELKRFVEENELQQVHSDNNPLERQ